MAAFLDTAVFVGAGLTAMSTIAATVIPQYRRIARILTTAVQ